MDREQELASDFAARDRAPRLEALQRCAGYFGIARIFPTRFDVDRGIPRLEPVLAILDTLPARRFTWCWTSIEGGGRRPAWTHRAAPTDHRGPPENHERHRPCGPVPLFPEYGRTYGQFGWVTLGLPSAV